MTDRNEQPEDIVPLLHDERLALYVATWPRLPKDADGVPDHDEVAVLLGMPPSYAETLWRKACAFGLVYADGTIHSMARGLIRAKVTDALNKTLKRGPKS